MSDQSYKRLIAYKVRVKDLLEGEYVKGEGWDPSYIMTKSSRKISRVNIVGTITNISTDNEPSFFIDDGQAQIPCRIFDKQNIAINVGEMVCIIGRPRDYYGEKYLIPEIVKKIESDKWLMVRKKELELLDGNIKEDQNPHPPHKVEVKTIEEQSKDKETSEQSSALTLIDTIRELDQGSGVDQEQIAQKINVENPEKIISMLLKEGEIFEVSPGKLKILE